MKYLATLLFLLVLNSIFGQNSLPDTVFVKLYFGGDFRSAKYDKGATDVVDSLVFIYYPQKEIYIADKIFKMNRTFVYDDDFNSFSINEDSTMTVYDETVVTKDQMKELIFWIAAENYETNILEKVYDFSNETDTTYFSIIDTLSLKKELSLDDFEIDEYDLEAECDDYNFLHNTDKKCDEINHDSLLNFALQEHSGILSVSSYSKSVSVDCKIDEKNISISQMYPRELNVKWKIKTQSEKDRHVYNPLLNKIISGFIPYTLKHRYNLLRYTDYENWIKLID